MILITVLILLTLLGGRLIQLQGLDAQALAAKALKNRQVDVELAARRGDITDVTGAVLAHTVDRRDVVVDPTVVILDKRGLDGVAALLAPKVGKSTASVRSALAVKGRYSMIAKAISSTDAREIRAMKIKGLYTTPTNDRAYPGGELAANLLGFVAADGKVYGGVESEMDVQLSGEKGSVTYERGKDGVPIPTGMSQETPAIDGSTVRLSINRDLQYKAQQLLAAQVKATKAESGTAIVLDPRTGAVLALAVAPTFDANNPGKAPEEDRGNRALTDVFEPGSTSKVITLAAALEEGAATADTQVTVPNRIKRANTTFRDSHDHETEKLTAAGVMAKSSNIGTIMLGEKVTPATIEKYMRSFGFGAKTGIGLAESSGILAPAANWSGSQRYTVLFGQGVSVTAMQAAQVFATIANDGVRVTPSVIAGYTDQGGVYHAAPQRSSVQVVSAETARTMRQMMEAVTSEGGTALQAAVPGYRVAGKTGTANRVVNGKYDGYTASFIGMAPADKPSLVAAVVVQNPTNGHFGGDVAGPVFRDLMTYALAQQHVPASTEPAAALPLTW